MFQPGKSGNAKGRPVGATSVRLRTARELVEDVFDELQKDPKFSLLGFARQYPRDYYAIWAKLLPNSIKAEVTMPEGLKIIYNADPNCQPIGTDPESDTGILGEQGSL
jgi:hypothetical protein